MANDMILRGSGKWQDDLEKEEQGIIYLGHLCSYPYFEV